MSQAGAAEECVAVPRVGEEAQFVKLMTDTLQEVIVIMRLRAIITIHRCCTTSHPLVLPIR